MSDDNLIKELHGIKIDSGGHYGALNFLSHYTEHELHRLVRDADSNSGSFMAPHDNHHPHYVLTKHHDGYKIIPKID